MRKRRAKMIQVWGGGDDSSVGEYLTLVRRHWVVSHYTEEMAIRYLQYCNGNVAKAL